AATSCRPEAIACFSTRFHLHAAPPAGSIHLARRYAARTPFIQKLKCFQHAHPLLSECRGWCERRLSISISLGLGSVLQFQRCCSITPIARATHHPRPLSFRRIVTVFELNCFVSPPALRELMAVCTLARSNAHSPATIVSSGSTVCLTEKFCSEWMKS